MTALPDVKCVKVDPKIHKALIVATDGLWDVVGDDQAVKIVSEFYPDDPQGAASSLTKSAFQLNSQVGDSLRGISVTHKFFRII